MEEGRPIYGALSSLEEGRDRSFAKKRQPGKEAAWSVRLHLHKGSCVQSLFGAAGKGQILTGTLAFPHNPGMVLTKGTGVPFLLRGPRSLGGFAKKSKYSGG